MNEKSTEKKRTETKTLKRIYKILMELRKLDEHWEGAIYSSASSEIFFLYASTVNHFQIEVFPS